MANWKKALVVALLLVVAILVAVKLFDIYSPQTYINPTFSYSLKLSKNYVVRTEQIKDVEPSKNGSSACFLEKGSDICFINIDAYPSTYKVPADASLQKNLVGQYSGVSWEKDGQTNYMVLAEKFVLHIYFKTKDIQTVKKIIDTIKI